jgi:hypothetical protein
MFAIPFRNSMNVPLQTIADRERAGFFARGKTRHAPLDGDVQVRDVVQDELDQRLVLLLAQEADERRRRQRLAGPERRQAVLRERVVKVVDDCPGERWSDYGTESSQPRAASKQGDALGSPVSVSWSLIFTRSLPPRTPTTTFSRSFWSSACISGLTFYSSRARKREREPGNIALSSAASRRDRRSGDLLGGRA